MIRWWKDGKAKKQDRTWDFEAKCGECGKQLPTNLEIECAYYKKQLTKLQKQLNYYQNIVFQYPPIKWYAIKDADPVAEVPTIAFTDLIAENERLRECMKQAGLECFMSEGTPEQISEHMQSIARSHIEYQKQLEEELLDYKWQLHDMQKRLTNLHAEFMLYST